MAYLSVEMRDILIRHIDGPVSFHDWRGGTQYHVLRACFSRGWIRSDDEIMRASRRAERASGATEITEKGRAVLSKALADWADALVRARFVADDRLAIHPSNRAQTQAAATLHAAE